MKRQHIIFLGVFLALLAALLFVVLPVTANLIIAYVFWLLGLVLLIVSLFAFGAKGKSILMELPLFIKARGYLMVTALLSALVLVLENLEVYTVPLALHLVVQVAVLLILGIGVAKLNLGKSYIESVGAQATSSRDKLAAQVADIKALKGQLSSLPNEDREKVQNALAEVADALRYADPISTPAFQVLDRRIADGVLALGRAVSAKQSEEALNYAKELLADIQERNERIKNSKR